LTAPEQNHKVIYETARLKLQQEGLFKVFHSGILCNIEF